MYANRPLKQKLFLLINIPLQAFLFSIYSYSYVFIYVTQLESSV